MAACALLDGDILTAEYSVQYRKKHSQSLVPMMDEIRRMVELDLSQVDALAVTAGPGSFTGLRIGAATAKGAALAMGCPIIPVPTVDAIAYGLWGAEGLVCPIMDARRHQVYTGLYCFAGEDMETLEPQLVTDLPVILERAAELMRAQGLHTLTLAGDGVPVYREEVLAFYDRLRAEQGQDVTVRFAPPHLARQRAAATASLAAALYRREGEACMVSADDFRPVYLRLSQAEQEHAERRDYRI